MREWPRRVAVRGAALLSLPPLLHALRERYRSLDTATGRIVGVDDHRLLTPAVAVRRRPRAVWLAAQAIAILLLASAMAIPALRLIEPASAWLGGPRPDAAGVSTIELPLGLIATFVPLLLAVAIWVRLVEQRPVSGLGFGGGRALRRFAIGFAVGAVSMTVTAALILLSGQGRLVPATQTTTVLGRAALPLIAVVLIGWFVQSCAEEVYLQGWLLPKAASTFGLPIGVALSSMVFFLRHTGNEGMTALARTNLLLYGTFAAIYALYDHGVLGIWGYHFAWNLTQANVFGLSVSGTAPHSASIVQIHTDPQGWLVGGGFGPEGGPITTAVLVASITVLALLHRHRAAHRPTSQAPDGMETV